MPKLELGKDQLELSFNGYQDFKNHDVAVKAIPGRRFEGERKVWCFPKTPAVIERLSATINPDISPEALSWFKQAKKESSSELVTPLPEDGDVMIPWGETHVPWQPEKFKGMFPHQRSFVEFAAGQAKSDRISLLLADDMGLGKCVQSASTVVEYLLRKSAYAESLDMPLSSFQSARDMLLWAGLEDEVAPSLVISPSSVKGTWRRELLEWLGDDEPVVVVDGTTPKKRHAQVEEGIENNAWTVINWEQLRVKKEKRKKKTKICNAWTGEFIRYKETTVETLVMREPLFSETEWLAAIADEAHRAKNRKSLQTQGLWKVDARIKMALTGTPLMNAPDELWPLLVWLFPNEYGRSIPAAKNKKGEITREAIPKVAYWDFFDQYVDYYEGRFGKVITGVKNEDSLRYVLSKRLVRRTKGEVLKDLPDKTRQFRPVALNKDQRKLYDSAVTDMWFEVEKAIEEGDENAKRFAETAAQGGKLYQVPNGASRIMRLQQIASTPALLGGDDDSAKLDAAEEIILDAQPKQFVVFTKFKGTAGFLAERLRKAGLKAEPFTGDLDSQERTRLEDEFQAGDIDVIIGTIDAMKEGITLTAADTVIFIERAWVPATNEQCEDRLHRMGQKNSVTVIILEAENTVDTGQLAMANAKKSRIVGAVINKDDVKETR